MDSRRRSFLAGCVGAVLGLFGVKSAKASCDLSRYRMYRLQGEALVHVSDEQRERIIIKRFHEDLRAGLNQPIRAGSGDLVFPYIHKSEKPCLGDGYKYDYVMCWNNPKKIELPQEAVAWHPSLSGPFNLAAIREAATKLLSFRKP